MIFKVGLQSFIHSFKRSWFFVCVEHQPGPGQREAKAAKMKQVIVQGCDGAAV